MPEKSLMHLLPPKPVFLAPLAGFSDSPYRRICRRMGSALSMTEFVSTDALSRDSARSIAMFRYREEERPLVFQIFGHDEDTILRGAEKVLALKPDGFDLNMGCSVKKIAHKGSGAGLLLQPEKVARIIGRMVRELKLPVSGKIRLGWDHSQLNYLEIGQILQDQGAWAVLVHGRTKSMAYGGRADWEAIARLKQHLSIPVFGNGDVTSLADAHEKMNRYGVDGVLIGRAAIGNPWIFAGQELSELGYAERLPVILEHLQYMTDFYGEKYGVLLFRKHLAKYLKGISGSAALKEQIMKTGSYSLLSRILLDFYA